MQKSQSHAKVTNSCKSHEVMRKSGSHANVTKSCESHEVMQKSESNAKVTKSYKSHKVMQKSRSHAKVTKSCKSHEFIQKSRIHAKVTNSCKSQEVMQQSRSRAKVTKSCKSHEVKQKSRRWMHIYLVFEYFRCFQSEIFGGAGESEQVSVGAEPGGGLESNLGLVVDGLPHQLDLRFRPDARIMHRFHPAYGMLRNWIDVVRSTKGE